jgi:hypothetical protein
MNQEVIPSLEILSPISTNGLTIPIEGLHFDQLQLSLMLKKYNEIGMQIELLRLFVSMNREVIPS